MGADRALAKGRILEPVHGFTSPANWDQQHPAVQKVLGTGPWAWQGVPPIAFLEGGLLSTPWGQGEYSPVPGSKDTLLLKFVGSEHNVHVFDCHKFHSVRESDGAQVDGWVQLGQTAHSCSW